MLLGGLNMGEYAYDFTGENAHDGASLQSARSGPHVGRIIGRLGHGRRVRHGGGLARLRHQRLDPRALLLLRAVRAEADLRPAVARGHFSVLASLDHLGPMARSALDLALLFDALQGDDPPIRASEAAAARYRRARSTRASTVSGSRLPAAISASAAMPEAFAAVDTVADALGVDREVDHPRSGAGARRGLSHHHGGIRRAAS